MDDRYQRAMQEHLSEARLDLENLAVIIDKEGKFDRLLMKSAERVLQTTIEACIGIAKHWAKKVCQYTPVDTYDTFERLSQTGVDIDLQRWKAIIGMRNALVHDYLKVDAAIVLAIFKNRE